MMSGNPLTDNINCKGKSTKIRIATFIEAFMIFFYIIIARENPLK